jgi:acyl-CoA hydrolase
MSKKPAKETAKASSSGKSPSQSAVTMTQMVLPQNSNNFGNVFGGTIMAWIDISAAIAAGRHSRKPVVTASVDALHFVSPIKTGYYVHIRAQVNFVSRTSMEVGVRVDSENPLTGEKRHAVTAYTTFVAIDEHGRPTPVPSLQLETAEDERRNESAKKRRESRMRLAEELKRHPGQD